MTASKKSPPAPLRLDRSDARRMLTRYHFAPGTVDEVLHRLGSVQFDPLSPLGCNHDLVLQARLPDYRVGAWQELAYRKRQLLDGWDKMASLVLSRDWPWRRIYHRWHGSRWRERVLDGHPEAVKAVLAELADRGPLAVGDVHFQQRVAAWEGSWYGPRLTKHILRGLWHSGIIATHHRRQGQHVYDLAERVVPAEAFAAPEPAERESVRWLLRRRHQAVGLLRPNAPAEVWSMPLPKKRRTAEIAALTAEGKLVAVDVEGSRYHAHPDAVAALDAAAADAPMRFLAPLDQLLWDRKAVAELFDFDYLWEVYKPAAKRRWGYYVLPVLYHDRLIARFDGRLVDGAWQLHAWYWEQDVDRDALWRDLEQAAARFMRYLGAERIAIDGSIDARTRAALERGAQLAEAA